MSTEIDLVTIDSFTTIYQTSSPQKRVANCLLFMEKGGYVLVQQIHSLLLKQPWNKTTLTTQVLEVAVNKIHWTLTSPSETEAIVSKEINLENTVQSFFRVTLIPNTPIRPSANSNMAGYTDQSQVGIITELILTALGTLTWYVSKHNTGHCRGGDRVMLVMKACVNV